MRRFYCLGLFFPLFLGCAGKNVVAGEEKTKAEQLESALPSWCQSTCTRLRACPPTPCDCAEGVCRCGGVDEKCEAQCQEQFAAFVKSGDLCADVGQRVKTCIDGVACGDLTGDDPCALSDAERAACPSPDIDQGDATGPATSTGTGGDAGPPILLPGASAGAGPSESYVPSSGGSAGAGTGGAGSTGGPASVSCSSSFGAGGGASDDGASRVTCEEGRDECGDGHGYSWLCARDSQGQRACSCLVDGQVQRGFEPTGDCPTLAEVNAGCAWALTQ